MALTLKTLNEQFPVDRETRIDDDFIRRLFGVLEARLKGVETKAADFDAATDQLLEVGLARVTEVLLPALEKVQDLTTLGFLIATSSTSQTLTLDATQLWIVDAGIQRDLFTPSRFVAMTRDANVNDFAIVETVSYDRVFGEYQGRVLSIHGAPGPHNDWVIGALAGSTIASLEILTSAQAIQAEVAASLDTIEDIGTDVDAKAVQVTEDRDTVNTLSRDYSKMWWGARTTAPPLTGDNHAIEGSQYLDIAVSPPLVRVYTTANGWVPTVTVSIGGIRHEDYTAGPSATNGPYSVGGGFDSGDVYRNGLKLTVGSGVTFDFVAGTFTTTGTVNGDKLAFRGYLANDTTDIFTKAESDARFIQQTSAGAQGLTALAAATLTAIQTAVGMSTYTKSIINSANAGAFLTAQGISAFVQTLLDDASAAAVLTTLGVSTFVQTLFDDAAATNVLTTLGVSTYAKTLLDDADAGTALSTLGITAFVKTLLDDADASAILTTLGFSTFGKTMIDDADASTALTTLGVSTFIKTLLDDANAASARATIGAADAVSPNFTGSPTAVTQPAGTNTNGLATTAFVRQEIAALIASSPGALDTLNELAAALGNDPNFATTVNAAIAARVSLATNENITGRKVFVTAVTGNSGMATATQNLGELEARSNGTGAAFMTFHRPGVTMQYLGIDTDNKLKLGGASLGAFAYEVWHDAQLNHPSVTLTIARANFVDAAFSAYLSGGNPVIQFDSSGGDDYLIFTRSSSLLQLAISSAVAVTLGASGSTFATNVTVDGTSVGIDLNKTGATGTAVIRGRRSGLNMWQEDYGDGAAHSGGNTGSNRYTRRFNDSGVQIDLPFSMLRVDGIARWANPSYFTDGGSSAPGIAFGSEPNTGIRRHAAGAVGFVTAGAENVWIDTTTIQVQNGLDIVVTGGGTVSCSTFTFPALGNSVTLGIISGSPEGVTTANPGSVRWDRTNGVQYNKKTGAGNTGWKLVTQAP